MMLNVLKSALKNKIFWYLASRYGVMGLQFLTTIFIAVKLGAYYFGIWSFIILLTTIGGQFNWGIGVAITVLGVQNKENEQKRFDYIFNSLFLVALTAVFPIAIAVFDRVIGIPLFEKYHLGNFVYAAALLVILQYFTWLYINIFRLCNKIVEVIIQQALWPIVMFCLIFFATGNTLLYLLVGGYLFAASFALSIFVWRGRKECFKGHLNRVYIRELFKKGFFLFLYSAGFMLITLSTKMLVSSCYPVNEFGYFAFAFSLASGIFMLVESFLFLASPKVIDLLKGDDFATITASISMLRKNYMTPLYMLFYIVLAVCPAFFYILPQYKESLLPFMLIMFTLLSYSICFGYSSFLVAQNKEVLLAVLVGAGLLLNVVLVTVISQVFNASFEYVILGTLISYIFYSSAVNFFALRLLKNFSWKLMLQESFPWCQTALWLFALFITLFLSSPLYLLLPLTIHFVLNMKELKSFVGNVAKLIKNEKLLNI